MHADSSIVWLFMKKLKNYTLEKYLDCLASKAPAPGGGSAAALVGALGTALISMVVEYSLGKGKPLSIEKEFKTTLRQSEKIRRRLLILVDLDAQAYSNVVKTRRAAPKIKKAALKKAQDVPREVCRLCYEAILLAPFLVKEGNRYLISDVKVAAEMLLAAFNSAQANVEANQ